MPDLMKTLSLVVLLAAGTPVLAQEAGDDTPAETPAEQPSDGTADQDSPSAPAVDGNEVGDTGLSMGEELSEGNTSQSEGPGGTYVAEVYEDWEQRCVRTEESQDPCQLYQLLEDDQGNAVAEFSIFNLPEEQQAAAGATIVTPLETLLTQQIRLSVDGGQNKRYPFTFCSQIGCFARVGFTTEDLNAFRSGRAATLTIVPVAAPDQEVNLTISLSGFTDGFEAVTAANTAE